MQRCYADLLCVRSHTCFPEILQRMTIMAILSSITPLLNSQTSNKHFELNREIFKNNILSAVDSWRPCLHTRGKSIVRYLGRLRNYWKTLPSTKIGKTNSPSKNTAGRSKRYPIDAYMPEENQSFGTWVGCVITGKHYRVQKLVKLILLRKTQQRDQNGILSILSNLN